VLLLLAVVAVVAVAAADERPSYYGDHEDAKYKFKWLVKNDYNHYGHEEIRDGDHTQGSYFVSLPDTRKQIVTYYVDGDSGFVAEVKYEGEAHYPETYIKYNDYEPPKYDYKPLYVSE
ncbi:Pro-resilin-like 13, partial [Homarus americanus]